MKIGGTISRPANVLLLTLPLFFFRRMITDVKTQPAFTAMAHVFTYESEELHYFFDISRINLEKMQNPSSCHRTFTWQRIF